MDSSSISRHQGVSGELNSKCLWMIRCCTCCRRIISVEPVAFLYVFTTYMYLATFELYAFTTKAVDELNTTINESCITSRLLNTYGSDGNKSTNVVQSEVAVLNLYVGIASQIPGIISALVLGPFSDRYGRKIAMGIVVMGLAFQSILCLLYNGFQIGPALLCAQFWSESSHRWTSWTLDYLLLVHCRCKLKEMADSTTRNSRGSHLHCLFTWARFFRIFDTVFWL